MSLTACARLDMVIFLTICVLILAVSAWRARRRRNRRFSRDIGFSTPRCPTVAVIAPAANPGDFVVRMVDFKSR